MNVQYIGVLFIGVVIITGFACVNYIFPKKGEEQKRQNEAKQKEESKKLE